MDECYRGHPNPLPSREPGQIPRQPQPPAGGVGGSVTQRAGGESVWDGARSQWG